MSKIEALDITAAAHHSLFDSGVSLNSQPLNKQPKEESAHDTDKDSLPNAPYSMTTKTSKASSPAQRRDWVSPATSQTETTYLSWPSLNFNSLNKTFFTN